MPFELPAPVGALLPLAFLLVVLTLLRNALRWLAERAWRAAERRTEIETRPDEPPIRRAA